MVQKSGFQNILFNASQHFKGLRLESSKIFDFPDEAKLNDESLYLPNITDKFLAFVVISKAVLFSCFYFLLENWKTGKYPKSERNTFNRAGNVEVRIRNLAMYSAQPEASFYDKLATKCCANRNDRLNTRRILGLEFPFMCGYDDMCRPVLSTETFRMINFFDLTPITSSRCHRRFAVSTGASLNYQGSFI
uniref:Uncharacterized protein n=1 Tax=Glossina pallidipes TaxID=7398 RepID=A0A1A9ZFP2_GLOPL